MADFDTIIKETNLKDTSINTGTDTGINTGINTGTDTGINTGTETVETGVNKINISELFDSKLISSLFIDIIDSIIVGGLMIYAKKKNVDVQADELKLTKDQKNENTELINNLVSNIKINQKAVGSVLITIAILSKYINSFKLINNKNKNEIEKNINNIKPIDNSISKNVAETVETVENQQNIDTITKIKNQTNNNENQGFIRKKAGRPKGGKNKAGHRAGRPKK